MKGRFSSGARPYILRIPPPFPVIYMLVFFISDNTNTLKYMHMLSFWRKLLMLREFLSQIQVDLNQSVDHSYHQF